jgi:predicted metal-dependent HD superfamily phosphohydrolase
MIRGLRNAKDLDDEMMLAAENHHISPHIETLWIPADPNMSVSSSLVKAHIGVDPTWTEQVARLVPAFVLEKIKAKYILGKFRTHWNKLMSEIGNPKAGEQIFEGLVKRYSEPHRAYHILEHIVNMLDELEEVISEIENPVAVKFAILYHDSVYDTGSKENPIVTVNEARSTHLAELDLPKLGVGKDVIVLVCGDLSETGLIMATTHKQEVTDPDTQYLVDIDLAILGKPEQEFDRYEAEIRKEYAWVPEDLFRSRRPMILQSFHDHPSIFYTEFFRNKYESAARKNLSRSITRLSA